MATSKSETNRAQATISLDNEREVLDLVANSIMGLWDVVNNLTRLRPTRRDRYRVVLVHKSAVGRGVGSYRCLSGDALRHRHAEPGHPVEHRAGDPGLGLLAGQSPGAEATTDNGLVAEHGGFPERAPAVADRLLPAPAALVPDHPDVLVALTGRGVSGRARHGRGAGRDDHCRGRVRLALGHGAVNGVAVVGAIGRDRGDGAGDLIEQRADQDGVTLLDGGQLAGKDLAAVGIDREMEFAPGPLATLAMLLGQPLARAVHLQAS